MTSQDALSYRRARLVARGIACSSTSPETVLGLSRCASPRTT